MIQINMQMPTNCLDCPACNEYLMCAIPINGRKWSENDVRDFSQGRPEWCPMKEQEAQWISIPHKRARICSHCEADEPYKFADDDAEVYEYCPHCGAKMTEGR